MLRPPQNGLKRVTGSRSPARRIISLLLLGFVVFQFSRGYLATPPDSALCPISHMSQCPMHHMDEALCLLAHNYHQMDTQSVTRELPVSDDDSCAFRCCKGTLNGLGIIPLQAFLLAAAVSHERPETFWVILTQRTDRAPENHISPPFQPPRYLDQLFL